MTSVDYFISLCPSSYSQTCWVYVFLSLLPVFQGDVGVFLPHLKLKTSFLAFTPLGSWQFLASKVEMTVNWTFLGYDKCWFSFCPSSYSQTFRVYVFLPLLPAFQGDVGEAGSGAIHAILHWEYKSICRGHNSLIGRLKDAGSKSDRHLKKYEEV